MYSRDKYHDTINGEALRTSLSEGDETFHEEILLKEITKQESETSRSCKVAPKVPPKTHQTQRWPTAAENSCPDILKNGHNYSKDGTNTSGMDVTVADLGRGCDTDPTLFIPPPPLTPDDPLLRPPGGATLGVSAVDLTSGKTKTIVIQPPHHIHGNQSSLVTLDGHFL